MSNRLLSLLVLTVIFGGLFGTYYYFFVANTASVSIVINGSGSTSTVLTSSFGKTFVRDCERSCLFADIPTGDYTVSAKRDGYNSVTKNFRLGRGKVKTILIAMEKEVILTEQKQKKEETIATIKLQKSVQEILETSTDAVSLGYRSGNLYYAIPGTTSWNIFVKKEGEEPRELFRIPTGTILPESLDIYEEHIALQKNGKLFFYSIGNGAETTFRFSEKILGVKDSSDSDTKIITGENGVFLYTVSEKTARENPLYDDIIQLASGEIVALVKKTSRAKRSLLSITDTANDFVFLIGHDTRERRTLLQTPKNGQILRYKNGEILFVEMSGEVFVVENVE